MRVRGRGSWIACCVQTVSNRVGPGKQGSGTSAFGAMRNCVRGSYACVRGSIFACAGASAR